ncbi:rubrerythrin family protein [Thermus scotoductus]|uniref:Rubrerythrin family protein n=1 Tax=Thermus scotoductus TaxID=37636 RepID=A0A430S9C7_THESC|nr:ferritin family protein [Thermus scotoductus]RTG96924.1 rubrerythrin family protein [Thermus scotoductus]RTH12284.1 rubrerythrin family protein [Thermus scotoductus]RTH13436.1 rubrerythrin family protein [Thermus scotoductus]RTH13657.1 rubrerythrin family protein [Thermus scotoductus]RTH19153.1 rubrerythrin family protein [Thermus scotoductus]
MDVLEVLRRAYQDELLDALRAERAAEGVPYPHVRALLQEVAARERAHAEAIAEALRKRGASLPPAPKAEEEGWEAMLRLLSEEGFDRAYYLESTFPDLELEALFTRLGQEEKLNQEAVRKAVALLGGNV